MALTLKEKLELQKTVRQGREKLRSGQIAKLSERLAIQREVRLALDKLKGTTTPSTEEPAPTGMTEEYRKLLAGEYNGLWWTDFGDKAVTICRAEAIAAADAAGESLSTVKVNSRAGELIKAPLAQYLNAHYDAEKDLFEWKAA